MPDRESFSYTFEKGVRGLRVLPLSSWNLFLSDHKETLDRDVVMIPELVVQDLATPAPVLLQALFDLMWNAGGWAKSPGVLRSC